MKSFLKRNWPLISIALLALVIRVFKLGEYPVGLTWDEPALGYNAYSIFKTGRDEYGQLLPITFKSFGDYKPGLFIYVMVPFVALFNLTKFAIRLPSALAGVVAMVAIFYLTQELINEKRGQLVPYLASILLAVSPWHIHFSRGAWEANFALTTILLSIFSFLKLFKTKEQRFMWLGFLFWAISVYAYHGAKVFLICLMFGLVCLFWSKLKSLPQKSKRVGLVLVVLAVVPLLTSFQGSANRAKIVSLFSYRRSVGERQAIIDQEESYPQLNFFLFHNEGLSLLKGLGERYLNHLSPRFLFFEGDWSSSRHSTPYMGMLYLIEFPFLIWGIGTLLADKKTIQEKLLLWWLLVGPVPAAVTRDMVHGIRSYWTVVPLMILVALGIQQFLNWAAKRRWLGLAKIGLVLAYLYFFALCLDLYYFQFPKKNSVGWNYGTEQVAQLVEESKSKYGRIIVTQYYGQPYIFYLFYNRYEPQAYQKQAYLKPDPQGDVGIVEQIDKIQFKKIYWPEDRKLSKTLFIGCPEELPLQDLKEGQSKMLGEIKFLDGRVAYRIFETLEQNEEN